MQKLAIMGVAAALAASSLAVTSGAAEARNRGHGGGAFAAGAILGLALGSGIGRSTYAPYYGSAYRGYSPYYAPYYGGGGYYAPRRYYAPGPVYYRQSVGGGHVSWCYNRYRSYDARSDTFLGYDGRRHYCRSPF